MTPSPSIVFAGTPDFAAASLNALLQAGHSVSAVYTQPDRPAGRGKKVSASPVKQLAEAHGLPVYQPVSLKAAEAQAELRALQPDMMVVAAYGLILPAAVLTIPRFGCINVHASLLPRWRGAAPIQRALLAGDETSGITIMQMEEGLDTGPMLLRQSVAITPTMTGGELHDQLALLGGQCLLDALRQWPLQAQPQQDSEATYASKLHKAEAAIDWQQPATDIERQVRAFNPWPVAFFNHQGKAVRVWEARIETAPADAEAGTVIAADKTGLTIACGDQALSITRLQLPGKKTMAWADVLNGQGLVLQPGDRIG